jgi:hypothetical protein
VRESFFLVIVALFVFCSAFGTSAQTPVLTQHNDNGRTGQNTSETILTTANVLHPSNLDSQGLVF